MTELVKQWAKTMDPVNLVCVPGLAVLAVWLLRTSLGRTALDDAPVRRNHQPLAAGATILALLVWTMPPYYAMVIVRPHIAGWPQWRVELLGNITMAVGALVTVCVSLGIARKTFARRLKGLGLGPKTIPNDLGAAFVNLLAIWPLILAMFLVISRIGEHRYGPTYQMEQHKELELLTKYPQVSLRISIVLLAVVVAPVVEEILFRGLLQTTIRSLVDRPWPAVGLTSAVFAMVHQNTAH